VSETGSGENNAVGRAICASKQIEPAVRVSAVANVAPSFQSEGMNVISHEPTS